MKRIVKETQFNTDGTKTIRYYPEKMKENFFGWISWKRYYEYHFDNIFDVYFDTQIGAEKFLENIDKPNEYKVTYLKY